MTIAKVEGLKELQQSLIELGSVTGTRVMRAAMFEASKPILEEAKANAADFQRSGALKESISRTFAIKVGSGFQLGSQQEGSRFAIVVGPKLRHRTAVTLYNLVYKRKRPIRGIFYGHLLEWGHRVGTRKTGYLAKAGRRSRTLRSQGVGRVRARPFLVPALRSKASQATQLLADGVRKRIERILKKRARAARKKT